MRGSAGTRAASANEQRSVSKIAWALVLTVVLAFNFLSPSYKELAYAATFNEVTIESEDEVVGDAVKLTLSKDNMSTTWSKTYNSYGTTNEYFGETVTVGSNSVLIWLHTANSSTIGNMTWTYDLEAQYAGVDYVVEVVFSDAGTIDGKSVDVVMSFDYTYGYEYSDGLDGNYSQLAYATGSTFWIGGSDTNGYTTPFAMNILVDFDIVWADTSQSIGYDCVVLCEDIDANSGINEGILTVSGFTGTCYVYSDNALSVTSSSGNVKAVTTSSTDAQSGEASLTEGGIYLDTDGSEFSMWFYEGQSATELSLYVVTCEDGHSYDYENATWDWSDDYSSCTATVECVNCGDELTIEAEVTSATNDDGSITYTATITDDDGNTYTDSVTVEATDDGSTDVTIEDSDGTTTDATVDSDGNVTDDDGNDLGDATDNGDGTVTLTDPDGNETTYDVTENEDGSQTWTESESGDEGTDEENGTGDEGDSDDESGDGTDGESGDGTGDEGTDEENGTGDEGDSDDESGDGTDGTEGDTDSDDESGDSDGDGSDDGTEGEFGSDGESGDGSDGTEGDTDSDDESGDSDGDGSDDGTEGEFGSTDVTIDNGDGTTTGATVDPDGNVTDDDGNDLGDATDNGDGTVTLTDPDGNETTYDVTENEDGSQTWTESESGDGSTDVTIDNGDGTTTGATVDPDGNVTDDDGNDLGDATGNGDGTVTLTDPDGNETTYEVTENEDGSQTWTESEDEEGIYTVTYTDGLGGEVFEDEVYTGLSLGDELPGFTGSTDREGYEFVGWSLSVEEDLSTLATMDVETVYASLDGLAVEGNMTFTAVWEEEAEDETVAEEEDAVEDGAEAGTEAEASADGTVAAGAVSDQASAGAVQDGSSETVLADTGDNTAFALVVSSFACIAALAFCVVAAKRRAA